MANNPFVKPTISLYNANPPPDDGTTGGDNEITWTGILAKVGNPLKTFAQAVADAVETFGTKTINTSANESNAMAGSLAFTSSELTISTGSITVVRSYHTVDTESDAATDDLDTIVLTGVSDGALLILSAANTGRTVVVKHGTGNILLDGGLDYSLDDTEKRIVLQRSGSSVVEICRSTTTVPPFQSAQQTITAAGILTLAHGLPSQPTLYTAVLVCTDAGGEHGYAQNDEAGPATQMISRGGVVARGCTLVPDATNVKVYFGDDASTFDVINKADGTPELITNSKWKLIVRAWV